MSENFVSVTDGSELKLKNTRNMLRTTVSGFRVKKSKGADGETKFIIEYYSLDEEVVLEVPEKTYDLVGFLDTKILVSDESGKDVIIGYDPETVPKLATEPIRKEPNKAVKPREERASTTPAATRARGQGCMHGPIRNR